MQTATYKALTAHNEMSLWVQNTHSHQLKLKMGFRVELKKETKETFKWQVIGHYGNR